MAKESQYYLEAMDALVKGQIDNVYGAKPQAKIDPADAWAAKYSPESRENVPEYVAPALREVDTSPNPFNLPPEDWARLQGDSRVPVTETTDPRSRWDSIYGNKPTAAGTRPTAAPKAQPVKQLATAPSSPNRQRSYTSAFKMPSAGGSQMSSALRAAPSAAGANNVF